MNFELNQTFYSAMDLDTDQAEQIDDLMSFAEQNAPQRPSLLTQPTPATSNQIPSQPPDTSLSHRREEWKPLPPAMNCQVQVQDPKSNHSSLAGDEYLSPIGLEFNTAEHSHSLDRSESSSPPNNPFDNPPPSIPCTTFLDLQQMLQNRGIPTPEIVWDHNCGGYRLKEAETTTLVVVGTIASFPSICRAVTILANPDTARTTTADVKTLSTSAVNDCLKRAHLNYICYEDRIRRYTCIGSDVELRRQACESYHSSQDSVISEASLNSRMRNIHSTFATAQNQVNEMLLSRLDPSGDQPPSHFEDEIFDRERNEIEKENKREKELKFMREKLHEVKEQNELLTVQEQSRSEHLRTMENREDDLVKKIHRYTEREGIQAARVDELQKELHQMKIAQQELLMQWQAHHPKENKSQTDRNEVTPGGLPPNHIPTKQAVLPENPPSNSTENTPSPALSRSQKPPSHKDTLTQSVDPARSPSASSQYEAQPRTKRETSQTNPPKEKTPVPSLLEIRPHPSHTPPKISPQSSRSNSVTGHTYSKQIEKDSEDLPSHGPRSLQRRFPSQPLNQNPSLHDQRRSQRAHVMYTGRELQDNFREEWGNYRNRNPRRMEKEPKPSASTTSSSSSPELVQLLKLQQKQNEAQLSVTQNIALAMQHTLQSKNDLYVQDVPQFGGDPRKFRSWIMAIEKVHDLTGRTEYELACAKCTEQVYRVITNLFPNSREAPTWKVMKEKLSHHFSTTPTGLHACALLNLPQSGDESLEDYINHFTELVFTTSGGKQPSEIKDQHYISLFSGKLYNPNIRRKMTSGLGKANRIDTLDSAFQKARSNLLKYRDEEGLERINVQVDAPATINQVVHQENMFVKRRPATQPNHSDSSAQVNAVSISENPSRIHPEDLQAIVQAITPSNYRQSPFHPSSSSAPLSEQTREPVRVIDRVQRPPGQKICYACRETGHYSYDALHCKQHVFHHHALDEYKLGRYQPDLYKKGGAYHGGRINVDPSPSLTTTKTPSGPELTSLVKTILEKMNVQTNKPANERAPINSVATNPPAVVTEPERENPPETNKSDWSDAVTQSLQAILAQENQKQEDPQ
jgi:hypothetical protein